MSPGPGGRNWPRPRGPRGCCSPKLIFSPRWALPSPPTLGSGAFVPGGRLRGLLASPCPIPTCICPRNPPPQHARPPPRDHGCPQPKEAPGLVRGCSNCPCLGAAASPACTVGKGWVGGLALSHTLSPHTGWWELQLARWLWGCGCGWLGGPRKATQQELVRHTSRRNFISV